jgi:hypothetical protein
LSQIAAWLRQTSPHQLQRRLHGSIELTDHLVVNPVLRRMRQGDGRKVIDDVKVQAARDFPSVTRSITT